MSSFNFTNVIKLCNGSNYSNYWELAAEGDSNVNFHIYSQNGNGAWLGRSDGLWRSNSDMRIKRDIHPLNFPLGFFKKLNPVFFNYKDQPVDSLPIEGFIAQEVEPIFPSLVSELTSTNYDFNIKGIGISCFIPYIVKMIQEQNNMDTKQIQIQNLRLKLKEINNSHRVKVKLLKSEITRLKNKSLLCLPK